MNDHAQISLSELQFLVKGAVEGAFQEALWVKAEISEITVNRSGHCYLDLVETVPGSDQVIARIRATIWSYTYRMLKPYFETTTGQVLTEGIKVLVQVKPEYHEVYGMSLNVRDIDPAYTLGDMAQQRREVIHRLENEGVLEMNKELELPVLSQRIAIISSPTAAGLQDFMDQIHNNPYGFVFYTRLFPAVMQGKDAPRSIMAALERIYAYEDLFDVVVIIRGGGAQVDLACFDNFDLAFHVTQFPLPVITGIGHDKDDTVTDLVAHTRLKTPTAVAEFLVSGALSFQELLNEMETRLLTLAGDHLEENQDRLSVLAGELNQLVQEAIRHQDNSLKRAGSRLANASDSSVRRMQYGLKQMVLRSNHAMNRFHDAQDFVFEKIESRISWAVRNVFHREHDRMMQLGMSLKGRMDDWMKQADKDLTIFQDKLRLIDPQNILKRGFTLTMQEGKIIKSAGQINKGDTLETRFRDGKITSKVIKK